MIDFGAASGEIVVVDIKTCPHLILLPEHYREDGTCRCDDFGHWEMSQWGYVWDRESERWIRT